MTSNVVVNVNKDNFQKRMAFNNPDRQNKSEASKESSKKYLKKMLSYYSNPDKAPVTILDFLQNEVQPESEYVNLVTGWDVKNKKPIFATKKNLEEIHNRNCKYIENSNLNQVVISFNNSFVNENITIEKLYEDMARKLLPAFFKDIGYDPKDISYQFSLHTDTDNLHFHVAFMEKKKSYQLKYDKEKKYRRKMMIDQKCINKFKASIHRQIEMEKFYTPLAKDVDLQIEKIKNQLKSKDNNLILENVKLFRVEEKFLQLGKLLDEERIKAGNNNRKIKYGSIKNPEIIKLTEDLAKDLFYNDTFNIKKDFDNAATNFANYLKSVDIEYNIKSNPNDGIVRKKSEEFDKTVFNQLVDKSLYEYRRQKYYSKDKKQLLHELAYQNYKSTKYKTKQSVIDFYLAKKNLYYDLHKTYDGFSPKKNKATPNFDQLLSQLAALQRNREYEVKKIQEQQMINWYDKTKY